MDRYEEFGGLIPDAVRPTGWFDVLPREWYRGREKIPVSQAWFDVYALPEGDLAIYEPGHFQEVISFLLLGRERALLWDTGMGIADIRALVGELTDLPLVVVNSHSHFDHMGGNWQFESVCALDHPVAALRIGRGLDRGQVAEHTTADQFFKPLPSGFRPVCYEIRPAKSVVPIKAGHVFDLGGRRLRVLHTPGHSPESIMLLDEERSLLLTGDTFYPATLYTHLDSGDGMVSDFAVYRRTMRHLADLYGGVEWLYCSHNEPVVFGDALRAVAEAFDAVAEGMASYQADARGLRLYRFDGFALAADPSKL